MNRTPSRRASLFGLLAFASLVLAVFTQLTFNDALRAEPWRVPATFALACVYTLLFTGCHRFLHERPRHFLRLYYVVQTLIVGAMIWISPTRGFFAIIALPLVSQAIFDVGVRSALLVALGILIPTVALWAHPYGWPGVLRAIITYTPAFFFAITFTLIARSALESRQKAEILAAELAAANDQLRAQAAQTAELATTRERNRLAREIHDGVGHYLTTIKVQLDAAAALLPGDPTRAADSVAKAARLAGEALDDVRRSVSALAADTARLPLADSLRHLAADASPAPTLRIEGSPRPLAPAAEHALYRAAQEGLTNIRKHAHATAATLTLDFRDPQHVRLTVLDNGQSASNAPVNGSGYGLRGLRERIALLRGRVSAAPRHDARGFELVVEIPAGSPPAI